MENAQGEIEVIAVIDGYELKKPLRDKVRGIYLKDNVGMREAINKGVEASAGKYIMRTDEHCIFGKGYDRLLTEYIDHNCIVTPRRYDLNPLLWTIMDTKPIDIEKLVIHPTRNKFHSLRWRERERRTKDQPLVETMAMQGSCWVMPRKHWDKIVGRLESNGYGTHYQDSVEMVFKTWQAGGKLISNKKTWYAHKHRSFKRTHNYGGEEAKSSWNYAMDTWGDYYWNVVRPKWDI
jgi:glycosyltransferase involved in cell wall biosynthesis